MSFEDFWYPIYVQHYRRDTMHLSLAQDGAYRRLIDEYMVTGAPLADNDVALARVCGCGLDEWLAIAPTIRAFFEASHGKLIHKRCEEELHAQRMLQASRTDKATAAANTRWKNHREIKAVMLQACSKHATSMPQAMLGDATRQDKERKRGGENGSLATAPPTGALRDPSANQLRPASEALAKVIREKGWSNG